MTSSEIEIAFETAALAAPRWRNSTFDARASVVLDAARLLEADQLSLASLMSREMGKPFREAVAEVKKSAWCLRFYAEHSASMLADEQVDSDATRSWVRYQPLGAVLGVMPWNFPLWQVFRFAGPALMAGNVALVKHAPSVPQCALAISEVFRRAGAPRGVYTNLFVDVEDVAGVIADARIRGVALTGSVPAGAAVASQAGAHIKPVVLELGGSDPFIVMPSADVDAAVKTAVTSRCLNNGQSCIAAKRLIVHESIADTFTTKLVAAMDALVVGDPMDEGVDVGPLASESLRDALAAQVEASVAAGATAALGCKTPRGPGFFYPPSVLTNVPAGCPAATEELFGPVASVFVVSDLDAALTMANDTRFGLGASIWTHDDRERRTAIDRLDAGAVFVNSMVKSDPRLPFGGTKTSGLGRELGRDGIRAFMNIKTVWVA